MIRIVLMAILYTAMNLANAAKVVNVYAWGGEIPKALIHDFENETGIKVNFSTYDSNETMYAKLKASNKPIYDVILPSGYYVERMHKQGMLAKLEHSKIPNHRHILPLFTHSAFDPDNQYSMPLIWGATGIFYNQAHVLSPPKTWSDLWQKNWQSELMLLDDAREIFSMALLSLGFSANDQNPKHIKSAYQKLLSLGPNIKLFSSEGIQSIIIDEDAIAGTSWNGDAYKAAAENAAIKFIYPKEGFVVWVDCLAILKDAPHEAEAYAFINFLLKAESGVKIARIEGHAISNGAGIAMLPSNIRNNPMVYPHQKTMRHAQFQRDVNEETLNLYSTYWEQLKLAL